MNTPVYDYLRAYAESGTLRMHMPGHKGLPADNMLSCIYPLDITEITDAGNLFEYDGIIAQSEKNASELFGTKASFYSAQGSTLCIQTMLALMKREGRKVIAVRNVHRAFLSACTLLGIDPEWIWPEYSDTIISGKIDIDEVRKKIENTPNACLYVTSPDYLGAMADIESLAEICHSSGAVLIVDNAHGACLPFYKTNRHPINLGADMCCDSAHKMLPALTGTAYLHIADERYVSSAKDAMLLFASTSPSYLMTCSLDLCNDYIDTKIRKRLSDAEKWITELRGKAGRRYCLEYPAYEREPLHFTINAAETGINGRTLASELRKRGIEYEFADDTYIVMLFSSADDYDSYIRVGNALDDISFTPSEYLTEKIVFPHPEKVMPVREAALCPFEEIPVTESAGRICASVNVPCPPAVPVVVSGELISEEAAGFMKKYGINTVRVLLR